MDRYCNKVYKFVLSQPDHEFLYQIERGCIPEDLGDYKSFRSACDYLVSQGYAKSVRNGGICLTHEGVHKRELEIRAFFRNFFAHFLPGFISGVLTIICAQFLAEYIRSLF